MARQALALLFALALVPISSCGDDDDAEPTGANSAACQDLSFRSPTADSVACPGTETCRCGGADVCCLTMTDDGTVVSSACRALESCRELAMTCDGPEDCADGQDCCFEGATGSCVAEGQCFGIDSAVLCRSNDDCPFVHGDCMPAADGSYFDGLVGACQ